MLTLGASLQCLQFDEKNIFLSWNYSSNTIRSLSVSDSAIYCCVQIYWGPFPLAHRLTRSQIHRGPKLAAVRSSNEEGFFASDRRYFQFALQKFQKSRAAGCKHRQFLGVPLLTHIHHQRDRSKVPDSCMQAAVPCVVKHKTRRNDRRTSKQTRSPSHEEQVQLRWKWLDVQLIQMFYIQHGAQTTDRTEESPRRRTAGGQLHLTALTDIHDGGGGHSPHRTPTLSLNWDWTPPLCSGISC